MKALWLVSFRPIGKSKINDFYQSIFVDSIKSLDLDITFSLTQFDEQNVSDFIKKKEIKNFYINIQKDKLPEGKKYSNKLMLDNALDQFIDKDDFQYLIFSTADIVVPNNLFKTLSRIKDDKYCALIYPNTHVKNGKIINKFWPHYGIDLIIFKITKNDAKNTCHAQGSIITNAIAQPPTLNPLFHMLYMKWLSLSSLFFVISQSFYISFKISIY